MKIMSNRSLVALAAALLLVAATAAARQDGPPRGDRGGHRGPPDAEMLVARMTEALDLSDEQSAQLLVVMQEVDQERDALQEQVMAQMKPEFCELQLRTDAEISTILTPEQLALYEEKKAARAEKGRGRQGLGKLDCSEYE